MRVTTVLLQGAKRHMSSGRSIKSLALSVYFKQPDLGMKDYEILSRASAFLLAVDPDPSSGDGGGDGPYDHLAKNERDRTLKMHKQTSNIQFPFSSEKNSYFKALKNPKTQETQRPRNPETRRLREAGTQRLKP